MHGNGLYDSGDPSKGVLPEVFKDLPQAFIDGNEDGVRGTNTTEPSLPIEEFVDFNNNGVYDNGDGQFNGVLRACDVVTPEPAGCPAGSAPSTINVRSTLFIGVSRHAAVFGGLPPGSPPGFNLSPCVNGVPLPTPQIIPLTITDSNGNSLAVGWLYHNGYRQRKRLAGALLARDTRKGQSALF